MEQLDQPEVAAFPSFFSRERGEELRDVRENFLRGNHAKLQTTPKFPSNFLHPVSYNHFMVVA